MEIYEQTQGRNYILAVDGGGTKTIFLAADCRGNVITRLEAGPLNLNGQKKEAVRDMLLDAAGRLKQRGFEPAHCMQAGIGTAGISNPEAAGLLKEIFRSAGFICEINMFGDHETALAAAFPSCEGCILIAGTGSVCMGMMESEGNKKLYRARGYGHLIDDGGSAYFIGKEILSAAVQSEDCREKKTILTQMIFKKLHLSCVEEMIRWVYDEKRTKNEIAALAVLCGDAAGERDKTACEILDRSADELAKLAKAVLCHMPGNHDLVFSGSVLLKNEHVCRRTQELLLEEFPDIHIKLAKTESAEGTLRLMMKRKAGAK